MLKRFVETRWPVSAVLSCEQVAKKKDCYLDLKNDQWTLAEEQMKILEPFEAATTSFSSEENKSISSSLPVLLGLVEGFMKAAPESDSDDSSPHPSQLYRNLKVLCRRNSWKVGFYTAGD